MFFAKTNKVKCFFTQKQKAPRMELFLPQERDRSHFLGTGPTFRLWGALQGALQPPMNNRLHQHLAEVNNCTQKSSDYLKRSESIFFVSAKDVL